MRGKCMSLPRTKHPPAIHAAPKVGTANELSAQVGQVERGRSIADAVKRSDGREERGVGRAGYGCPVARKEARWRGRHREETDLPHDVAGVKPGSVDARGSVEDDRHGQTPA